MSCAKDHKCCTFKQNMMIKRRFLITMSFQSDKKAFKNFAGQNKSILELAHSLQHFILKYFYNVFYNVEEPWRCQPNPNRQSSRLVLTCFFILSLSSLMVSKLDFSLLFSLLLSRRRSCSWLNSCWCFW